MCIRDRSSGHLSEYLPYYRKSEAGRKLLRLGYDGGSRFYACLLYTSDAADGVDLGGRRIIKKKNK